MDVLLLNRFGREGIEEVRDAPVIGSLKEILNVLDSRGIEEQ